MILGPRNRAWLLRESIPGIDDYEPKIWMSAGGTYGLFCGWLDMISTPGGERSITRKSTQIPRGWS